MKVHMPREAVSEPLDHTGFNVVWSQDKGRVIVFFGMVRIEMSPEECILLENELAAVRRVPARVDAMLADG